MKIPAKMLALGLVMLAGVTTLAPLAQGQSENLPPKDLRYSDPSCPTISVSCPSNPKPGELITFSATIRGADPSLLTYTWTANRGTIVEGQGTPIIMFKPSGDTSFTGSVAIGGLNPGCAASASCSILSCHNAPASRKFDSYGYLSRKEETERLSRFGEALKNEPGAQGYLLIYEGRQGPAGEAKATAQRAKAHLVDELEIQVERIVTVDAGLRNQLTIELWVVPSGAALPTAASAPDLEKK